MKTNFTCFEQLEVTLQSVLLVHKTFGIFIICHVHYFGNNKWCNTPANTEFNLASKCALSNSLEVSHLR